MAKLGCISMLIICNMRLDLDLWLIVEVASKKNDLLRSYIIDPSEVQFYRTTDLHERDHFILRGSFEVSRYEEGLKQEGMTEVSPQDLLRDPHQEGVYTRLSPDQNHILQEIAVINLLSDPETAKLIANVRLLELANHVTGLEDIDSSATEEDRGNMRMDIGFCGQNTKDKETVPGLNVPYFKKKYDKYPGLQGDNTLTNSLIKSSIALKKLVDHLEAMLGVSWSDFKRDQERKNTFPRQVALNKGLADWEHFITEGNTFGMNGALPDGVMHLLKRHRDTLNSRMEGHSAYWGLVVHEVMQYASGEATVRLAYGGYDKACIDGVYRRLRADETILKRLEKFRKNHPELFRVDREMLYVPANQDVRCTPYPRIDKSVYYSIFIHGLLAVGEATNYDKAAMYEAVLVMTLTPFAEGWYDGVLGGAAEMGGRNLSESFIDYLKRDRGGVVGGRG